MHQRRKQHLAMHTKRCTESYNTSEGSMGKYDAECLQRTSEENRTLQYSAETYSAPAATRALTIHRRRTWATMVIYNAPREEKDPCNMCNAQTYNAPAATRARTIHEGAAWASTTQNTYNAPAGKSEPCNTYKAHQR